MAITASGSSVRVLSLRSLAALVVSVGIIAGSVGVFVSEGVRRDTQASFYMFYAAGQLWNAGDDPYDYPQFRARYTAVAPPAAVTNNSGYYYPPPASALFGVLARFPLPTARLMLLSLTIALLAACVFLLARILRRHHPVGLFEVALLASLINTGFGRVNARQGQLGALCCALILLMYLLAGARREGGAGAVLGATMLKPTFMPLFIAVAFVRRSYRAVIAALLATAALIVLPLVVTHRPMAGTLLGWARMLQQQRAPGSLDDPSPFTPNSAQMLHLEPLVYRLLNAYTPPVSVIAWLSVAALSVGTLFLVRRASSGPEDLLDFGLVCALSLLVIYHRSYDSFLLFPGMLYLYVYAARQRDAGARRRWLAFLLIVLGMLMLPGDLSMRLTQAHPALQRQYLWRVVAPFQTWAGIAVFAVLVWRKLALDRARAGRPRRVPGHQDARHLLSRVQGPGGAQAPTTMSSGAKETSIPLTY